MLLCNKWEDLDAAENEATSFLSFFIDRDFFKVALEFDLRDFCFKTERFFVDLVVAGNFRGFHGFIWGFLNGFYCCWFSDRIRSSVMVVELWLIESWVRIPFWFWSSDFFRLDIYFLIIFQFFFYLGSLFFWTFYSTNFQSNFSNPIKIFKSIIIFLQLIEHQRN